ncbi:hypothetical protein GGR50DRAFT_664894, partial [Xylaria sp. CBS 124048]
MQNSECLFINYRQQRHNQYHHIPAFHSFVWVLIHNIILSRIRLILPSNTTYLPTFTQTNSTDETFSFTSGMDLPPYTVLYTHITLYIRTSLFFFFFFFFLGLPTSLQCNGIRIPRRVGRDR